MNGQSEDTVGRHMGLPIHSNAVADAKPRRGRKATPPKERKPRTVKPAEYAIQQWRALGGDNAPGAWFDVATEASARDAGVKDTGSSGTARWLAYLRNLIAAGAMAEGRYQVVAVKRILDAKVETQKKVILT